MIKKPKIYIAGPYTQGALIGNIRNAMNLFEDITRMGGCPYCPHLSAFQDLVHPHDVGFWYNYDTEWLDVCNALYRIPGYSPGADNEVQFMLDKGKPVLDSYEGLVEYIKDWYCAWKEETMETV